MQAFPLQSRGFLSLKTNPNPKRAGRPGPMHVARPTGLAGAECFRPVDEPVQRELLPEATAGRLGLACLVLFFQRFERLAGA